MKIAIDNISVAFDNTQVLSNFSLSVPDGEVCSLLGTSGCGKSTLLRVVAGLVTPDEGRVLLGDVNPDPRKQKIALVPQNYGLLPWKKVNDNLLLGLRLHGDDVDDAMVADVVERLRLDGLLQRYPHELSGGQQQRVALGRAFLQKPDVLLMDEPFAALDALTSERCRELFMDIWNRYRVTTIFVTHSVAEAVELGTMVALMGGTPANSVDVWRAPVDSKLLRKAMEGLYNE